jgi:transposase
MNEAMNYVGIDVHKQSFQAAVVDEGGNLAKMERSYDPISTKARREHHAQQTS